jgi:hypothetical protein
VEEVAVPSVAMLRAELTHAQHIIATVAGKVIAGDTHFEGASGSAAKLMMASAQAASAIAKIVDAETRQRLATARIDHGYFPPPRFHARRTPPREGSGS